MSFEWQTEEEYRWEEPAPEPKPPGKPQRRLWPWILVGVLLVIGTAVFLLYRQLNQRVETATDGVEADLLASYALMQQAAVNRDDNLFRSMLSGRDPDWAMAQRDNINAGLMFDRPGFGLTWQPVLAETAVLSQTLSPDLKAAELTSLQNFSLDIGNGLTQTVQLKRLDIYRLGVDRWLLAPPDSEFWGPLGRLEGQLLSVRYPVRDEAIVHRLAADLEAKLVQFCAAFSLTCPEEAKVRLVFSAEPARLSGTTFAEFLTGEVHQEVLQGRSTLRLPTPSLVGLPQDEQGYQALLRGYSRQVLTAALNDASDWACCQNLPFYRAAVERYLAENGVINWPLTGTAVSLPTPLILAHGGISWNSAPPVESTGFAADPVPFAVVDFLSAQFQLPAGQIAASVAGSTNLPFNQWLTELAGPGWTEATLGQAFREHVAPWQTEALEVVEPEAELYLLCRAHTQTLSGLYRYDFAQEEAQLVQEFEYANVFIAALPDGSGVAAVGQRDDELQETFLLRNGSRIDVTWNAVAGITVRPPLAVPTVSDPNGRYLLWTIAQGFTTGTFFALTDLEACQQGSSCEAIPLGGYPVWSPNAERLITLTVINPWWSEGLGNGLMLLRPSPDEPVINSPGFGSSIFWLDDEQFGYLTLWQNGRQQVTIANGGLDRPSVVVDNESLRRALPEETRPSSLVIQLVQPLPNNPRVVVILAADRQGAEGEYYLFHFDRAAGGVTNTVRLGDFLPGAFNSDIGIRFSPDGRFLLLALESQDGAVTMLLQNVDDPLHPLVYQLLGETPYPRHFYASWSPDGEWLAMPELGYVRLWEDGWDERLLTFENLSCTNSVWVNKIE